MRDAFAAVLGTNRGVERVQAVELPTSIERARSLVRWTNEQASDDLVSFLNAEREKTAELTLFLKRGFWRQDSPAPSVDTIRTLTAVFEADGTPIGFIEQLNDEVRLLRYDFYAAL
jgi:hypothetical protein